MDEEDGVPNKRGEAYCACRYLNCGRKFKSLKALEEHLQAYHNISWEAYTRYSPSRHQETMEETTGDVLGKRKDAYCTCTYMECGRKFKMLKNLEEHVTLYHNISWQLYTQYYHRSVRKPTPQSTTPTSCGSIATTTSTTPSTPKTVTIGDGPLCLSPKVDKHLFVPSKPPRTPSPTLEASDTAIAASAAAAAAAAAAAVAGTGLALGSSAMPQSPVLSFLPPVSAAYVTGTGPYSYMTAQVPLVPAIIQYQPMLTATNFIGYAPPTPTAVAPTYLAQPAGSVALSDSLASWYSSPNHYLGTQPQDADILNLSCPKTKKSKPTVAPKSLDLTIPGRGVRGDSAEQGAKPSTASSYLTESYIDSYKSKGHAHRAQGAKADPAYKDDSNEHLPPHGVLPDTRNGVIVIQPDDHFGDVRNGPDQRVSPSGALYVDAPAPSPYGGVSHEGHFAPHEGGSLASERTYTSYLSSMAASHSGSLQSGPSSVSSIPYPSYETKGHDLSFQSHAKTRLKAHDYSNLEQHSKDSKKLNLSRTCHPHYGVKQHDLNRSPEQTRHFDAHKSTRSTWVKGHEISKLPKYDAKEQNISLPCISTYVHKENDLSSQPIYDLSDRAFQRTLAQPYLTTNKDFSNQSFDTVTVHDVRMAADNHKGGTLAGECWRREESHRNSNPTYFPVQSNSKTHLSDNSHGKDLSMSTVYNRAHNPYGSKQAWRQQNLPVASQSSCHPSEPRFSSNASDVCAQDLSVKRSDPPPSEVNQGPINLSSSQRLETPRRRTAGESRENILAKPCETCHAETTVSASGAGNNHHSNQQPLSIASQCEPQAAKSLLGYVSPGHTLRRSTSLPNLRTTLERATDLSVGNVTRKSLGASDLPAQKTVEPGCCHCSKSNTRSSDSERRSPEKPSPVQIRYTRQCKYAKISPVNAQQRKIKWKGLTPLLRKTCMIRNKYIRKQDISAVRTFGKSIRFSRNHNMLRNSKLFKVNSRKSTRSASRKSCDKASGTASKAQVDAIGISNKTIRKSALSGVSRETPISVPKRSARRVKKKMSTRANPALPDSPTISAEDNKIDSRDTVCSTPVESKSISFSHLLLAQSQSPSPLVAARCPVDSDKPVVSTSGTVTVPALKLLAHQRYRALSSSSSSVADVEALRTYIASSLGLSPKTISICDMVLLTGDPHQDSSQLSCSLRQKAISPACPAAVSGRDRHIAQDSNAASRSPESDTAAPTVVQCRRRHLKFLPSSHPPSDLGVLLVCSDCDFGTASSSDYVRHRFAAHCLFTCQVCQKGKPGDSHLYRYQATMARHLMLDHGFLVPLDPQDWIVPNYYAGVDLQGINFIPNIDQISLITDQKIYGRDVVYTYKLYLGQWTQGDDTAQQRSNFHHQTAAQKMFGQHGASPETTAFCTKIDGSGQRVVAPSEMAAKGGSLGGPCLAYPSVVIHIIEEQLFTATKPIQRKDKGAAKQVKSKS